MFSERADADPLAGRAVRLDGAASAGRLGRRLVEHLVDADGAELRAGVDLGSSQLLLLEGRADVAPRQGQQQDDHDDADGGS